MALIKLEEGFSVIPEGTYVFKITECIYNKDYNKIEVKLETENGQFLTERYNLDSDGGIKAFSFLAKNALNDFSAEEVDTDELVGHFIEADVVHTQSESTKEPGKMLTFANLKNKRPSAGFSGEKSIRTATPQNVAKKSSTSLKDILG